MKPIKKEKGKAPAKSKGQKKGIKSTETMEMPAEDVKVESELMSEEKENHNYNNNNIAIKTGTVEDVKVEHKAVSVKEGIFVIHSYFLFICRIIETVF